VLIVVNPRCHQNRGWKRWLSVRNDVLRSLPHNATELVLEDGMDLTGTLLCLPNDGQHNFIISAGGDGSMHYLVNALLKSSSGSSKNITLGAIGLGSSNDFLKPFNKKINGIPVRIDVSAPVSNNDVGLAVYYDENNGHKKEYFIVNASIGVTASANWTYNNPGLILRFLKSRFTSASILYTALVTILSHKNIDCHLKFNATEMDFVVSNINILKIPFVSGSFRYDQKILPDDGNLGLHICRDMNRVELLRILSQLENGKFSLGEKTISEVIKEFHLSSEQPLIFECDGETSLANNISISVVPKAINVLSA
jgi:diacylglycerol kinase (ATP)